MKKIAYPAFACVAAICISALSGYQICRLRAGTEIQTHCSQKHGQPCYSEITGEVSVGSHCRYLDESFRETDRFTAATTYGELLIGRTFIGTANAVAVVCTRNNQLFWPEARGLPRQSWQANASNRHWQKRGEEYLLSSSKKRFEQERSCHSFSTTSPPSHKQSPNESLGTI